MPEMPKPEGPDPLSAIEEADPAEWLERSKGVSLTVQTLHQQGGFGITLLSAERPDEDDDDGIDDAFDRFQKFSK